MVLKQYYHNFVVIMNLLCVLLIHSESIAEHVCTVCVCILVYTFVYTLIRGVASIGLSGLEPPLCLPKVGSVGGPTVYGCTIAWPDKLKLLDKPYKIYN